MAILVEVVLAELSGVRPLDGIAEFEIDRHEIFLGPDRPAFDAADGSVKFGADDQDEGNLLREYSFVVE